MKKSLIILLAFLVVGALAYAAEPTAELKIIEFSGNASVTLGFDIDRGMAAFTNAVAIDLKVNLVNGGDKSTTGDGIWGLLKIETNDSDNSIRIGNDDVTTNDTDMPGLSVPDLKVVTAQLNIGKIAYIGIKSDGTQLDYTDLMDEAAGFYVVDTTKFYGTLADTGDTGALVDDLDIQAPEDFIFVATNYNAKYGIVLGVTPEGIGTFTVDFRSVPDWATAPTFFVNNWGLRVKADITAVPNLTLKAGASYSIGQAEVKTVIPVLLIPVTVEDPRDFGFGGLVAYKIAISDTMYVQPQVAVDAQYWMLDPDFDPESGLSYEVEAGVRLGWGDKSKLNLYFSPDNDTDWGYYPGITAGVRLYDFDSAEDPDPLIGVNVSAFTGALVPNLSANVAVEIADIMAEDLEMGFSANAKYDLAMDPMTITPKVGAYYYSNAALTGDAASDFYLKAGLDIAKIFPNCTLSFAYASNDFIGGVVKTDGSDGSDLTLGKFETKFKISF